MINLPVKLVRINEGVAPQGLVEIEAVAAVAREDVAIAVEADKEPQRTLTIKRIVLPRSKLLEKSIDFGLTAKDWGFGLDKFLYYEWCCVV